MNLSAQFDRGDLSKITNQSFDEEIFADDADEDAGEWHEEWNRYLSSFYDDDDSVYVMTV